MKVYCNGAIHDAEALKDILEPGFLFGWGVFETLRVYNVTIPFLNDHLRRLRAGCRKIGIAYVALDFQKQIEILLKRNNVRNAYCRITLFKKRTGTGVIIYVAPFTYYKDDDYKKGFTAIISSFIRNAHHPLVSVKAINYLENRLAWKRAQDKRKDEALFLNEKGYLSEGSRTNLFFIKNRTVYTPSFACGMLNGITRQKVIALLKRKKVPLCEGKFTLKALLRCDEAFLTSSLMEVMPLVEVNGTPLGSGKPGLMVKQIHLWYKELAHPALIHKE